MSRVRLLTCGPVCSKYCRINKNRYQSSVDNIGGYDFPFWRRYRNQWNADRYYHMLCGYGVNWHGKLRSAKWASRNIALYMYLFLTALHMDYGARKLLETYRAFLAHY